MGSPPACAGIVQHLAVVLQIRDGLVHGPRIRSTCAPTGRGSQRRQDVRRGRPSIEQIELPRRQHLGAARLAVRTWAAEASFSRTCQKSRRSSARVPRSFVDRRLARSVRASPARHHAAARRPGSPDAAGQSRAHRPWRSLRSARRYTSGWHPAESCAAPRRGHRRNVTVVQYAPCGRRAGSAAAARSAGGRPHRSWAWLSERHCGRAIDPDAHRPGPRRRPPARRSASSMRGLLPGILRATRHTPRVQSSRGCAARGPAAGWWLPFARRAM